MIIKAVAKYAKNTCSRGKSVQSVQCRHEIHVNSDHDHFVDQ